jgi:hypothetical protein
MEKICPNCENINLLLARIYTSAGLGLSMKGTGKSEA